jgi:hypothetical protein
VRYLNPIEHLYQEELYNIRSKILVIIPVPWDRMSESEQFLLSKILTSIKQTLASVQILSIEDAQADDLLIYRPSAIIAFGSILKVPGQVIQPYTPFKHRESVILQADNLSELEDATRKKNLWNALRGIFQV